MIKENNICSEIIFNYVMMSFPGNKCTHTDKHGNVYRNVNTRLYENYKPNLIRSCNGKNSKPGGI